MKALFEGGYSIVLTIKAAKGCVKMLTYFIDLVVDIIFNFPQGELFFLPKIDPHQN